MLFRSAHLSILFAVIDFFFFLMYFHMSLVAMVVVFDFGFGEFSGFLFCSSSLVWLC